MAETTILDNFKKAFRVFKGEEKCPYSEETLEQRHKWFMWNLEKELYLAGVRDIINLYMESEDKVPDEIASAKVSDAEKMCAFYLYTSADTMMSKIAFNEYFSMPVVFRI